MRHKLLVLTVKKLIKSVYIYGSYRKIKTGVSLFWTTRYNIAGLIFDVSEEVATQIAKNCSRQPPHSHLRSPPRKTPANIRIYLIFPETRVIGLHFLSLHVRVYLHSNLCSGLQKTHLFCTRVRFGRSRSLRVIQGR